MDRSAIEYIGQLAIDGARANHLDTPIPAIVLTDASGNQHIESLEKLGHGRERFRGNFTTPSFDDFVNHVSVIVAGDDGRAAPVFVDVANMAATAFFNLGTVAEPGHGDWTGKLKLKATAAFEALCAIDGKKLSQKDLAEWLEDWNDFISADYVSGDGTLARAIAAIRKMTIEKQGKATHGVTATSAEMSAMEKIEAQADELPMGFTWVCEPYVGLKQRPFRLALSVLTSGPVPLIVLRWQRREAVVEEIAKEFKNVLAERLGTSASVTVGTFTP